MMQWCTDKEIPEDTLNIDICKCYPSILLNNNQPIPIYMIHDTIEEFGCKSDLRHTGEFYLDETISYNFKTPIKIEAGFYSHQLVQYVVDVWNMSTETIKYKITTRKALNPKTFSKFIEFVFDTFPEAEAKKLTNSFIGDLGRRYNKTNYGFTCTEYDTAMGCWKSGLAEGKKCDN